MIAVKAAPIPTCPPGLFEGGIVHPSLWLWDSWTMEDNEGLHLYCLALSKTSENGGAITPPERNDNSFHIRHFLSKDGGQHWLDLGVALWPGFERSGADKRNIWSGSVVKRNDGKYLFAYTGVRMPSPVQPFLQSICIGVSDSANALIGGSANVILSADKHYDEITSTGYYLGPNDTLGHKDGEEGGPILAWRDPFLLFDENGTLHAFWSGKIAPTQAAIAHATLKLENNSYSVDALSTPITLPDDDQYTQAEVPKIYPVKGSNKYLLIVSSCDRRFEGQPDSEVNQDLRVYFSDSLTGPWREYRKGDSRIPDLNYMFGASVIDFDHATSTISLLGPYTENAGPERQLSFEAVKRVKLDIDPDIHTFLME